MYKTSRTHGTSCAGSIVFTTMKVHHAHPAMKMLSELSDNTRQYFRGFQTKTLLSRLRTLALLTMSTSPLQKLAWWGLGSRIHAIIGLDGSKVIAFGFLRLNRDISKAHVATLGVVVHDKYQRTGVGSALMRILINDAVIKGVKKVCLDVDCENTRAIALYEKFGFKVEGILKSEERFSGRYLDVLRMSLFL